MPREERACVSYPGGDIPSTDESRGPESLREGKGTMHVTHRGDAYRNR